MTIGTAIRYLETRMDQINNNPKAKSLNQTFSLQISSKSLPFNNKTLKKALTGGALKTFSNLKRLLS